MQLLETVKRTFLKKKVVKNTKDVSSFVHPDNVIANLGGEELSYAWASNDVNIQNYLGTSIFNRETNTVAEQATKIDIYRKVALHNSEVKNCIDEIVNETVGAFQKENPLSIEYTDDNKAIENAVKDSFNEICSIMNISNNLHEIVRSGYIDGQIVLHLTYDNKRLKSGIRKAELIDPKFLFFDAKSNTYKYAQDPSHVALYATAKPTDPRLEFSPEEIVRVDFGLYEGYLCLSYLEFGIKNANILQTLEDLLVPLRFSRSISRRVFNVDVGNLPPKRVEEVMKQIQGKFKYKKFYNQETGEISNQQHITSMVEDYWFANRSGGKGTSVDVLDETGNLGELADINYYVKKLYRSLNVPISRSQLEDQDPMFDFESTNTSKEDIKFFNFVSRLRNVYAKLFKGVLKRHIVAKKVLSEKEFDMISDNVKIIFTSENQFIERMKQANLRNRMDVFSMIEEQIGKIFSVQSVLKDLMHMTDEEIDRMAKEIKAEEKDPKYKKFYQAQDEEY